MWMCTICLNRHPLSEYCVAVLGEWDIGVSRYRLTTPREHKVKLTYVTTK